MQKNSSKEYTFQTITVMTNMKKLQRSEIEHKYRRFDIVCKVIAYSFLVFTVVFGMFFVLARTDEFKVLFGCFLSLNTALIIIVCSKLANIRTKYLQTMREEREVIIRTGIFKDAYEAYKRDGFEFNLTFDKLLFEEYCNNTIDLGLIKNGHEFLITIDEDAISIVVDEETDSPIETESALSSVVTLEQLYLIINSFIDKNS